MAKSTGFDNKYVNIITSVAGAAAAATLGVASVSTEPGSAQATYSKNTSKKASVLVELRGNNCYIDLSLNAKNDVILPELIADTQENVKREVEKATFYRVKSVNVTIVGVVF